ncbi:MAG: hypothetical protein KDB79_06760, partial [Acidobacteria bacterium]|nr:hypothetical protein [Acidobacteriota bacterium]
MNAVKRTLGYLSFGVLITLLSGSIIFAQKSDTANLITSTSVGAINLGMTIGEARKVLPKGLKLGPAPGDEGTTNIGVYEGDKLLLEIGSYGEARDGEELPPIDETQKIYGIWIADARYKTADGVHVGTTIADAEKQYGTLKEMFNYPHLGEFGKFARHPEHFGFTFSPKGDRQEGEYQQAGIYEEVPNCPDDAYPPSCRVARKYNPGSYISGISIQVPDLAQKITNITDAPKNYKVSILAPMRCVDGSGETTYSIVNSTGDDYFSQEFRFDGLKPCPEEGEEFEETSVSYKEQWDVFLGDYNFDGMMDLALRDGMNGGYGFPSYQVYLYSKADKKFILSDSFTELGQFQG